MYKPRPRHTRVYVPGITGACERALPRYLYRTRANAFSSEPNQAAKFAGKVWAQQPASPRLIPSRRPLPARARAGRLGCLTTPSRPTTNGCGTAVSRISQGLNASCLQRARPPARLRRCSASSAGGRGLSSQAGLTACQSPAYCLPKPSSALNAPKPGHCHGKQPRDSGETRGKQREDQ